MYRHEQANVAPISLYEGGQHIIRCLEFRFKSICLSPYVVVLLISFNVVCGKDAHYLLKYSLKRNHADQINMSKKRNPQKKRHDWVDAFL